MTELSLKSRKKEIASGFTLIELIIVLIIMAVLASLALPRFVKVIERARGVEGIAVLQSIRGAMERCYLWTRNYNKCIQGIPVGVVPTDITPLGIGNPQDAPNSHFYVTLYGAPLSGDSYMFAVSRNDHELLIPHPPGSLSVMCPGGMGGGGSPARSQIALCVSPSGVQIIGSGFYEGIAR